MKKFFRRLFGLLLLLVLVGGVGIYYTGNWSVVREYAIEKFEEWGVDLGYNKSEPDSSAVTPAPVHGEQLVVGEDKNDQRLMPLPVNPYAAVDRHARNCPESAEQNIASLSSYLAKGTKNDLEKARAIYVWLADNVSYDDDGYNTNNLGDCTAEGVLVSRKSVCAGFASVFLAVGEAMGLEVEKVSGYAKGYGYSPGQPFTKANHAWNLVKVNSKWRVFDATWGEGHGESIDGKLKSTKEFDGYWFNVDPYEAIFNHLPEKSSQAHVSPGMTLRAFNTFPHVEKAYFEMGFDAKSTYELLQQRPDITFPKSYGIGTPVEMRKAHAYEGLVPGKAYDFEFYVPRGLSMAIIDADGKWHEFERSNGVFSLTFEPSAEGEVQLAVKYDKGGSNYHTVLIYKARKFVPVS